MFEPTVKTLGETASGIALMAVLSIGCHPGAAAAAEVVTPLVEVELPAEFGREGAPWFQVDGTWMIYAERVLACDPRMHVLSHDYSMIRRQLHGPVAEQLVRLEQSRSMPRALIGGDGTAVIAHEQSLWVVPPDGEARKHEPGVLVPVAVEPDLLFAKLYGEPHTALVAIPITAGGGIGKVATIDADVGGD